MAPNKKRKLNPLAESKSISAFAARKRLQFPLGAYDSGSKTISGKYESLENFEEGRSSGNTPALSSEASIEQFEGETQQGFDQSRKSKSGNLLSSEDDEDLIAPLNKRSRQTEHSHLSEQSWDQLTTVNLNKGNVEQLKGGTLRISLGPGEKLVVLGQYGLSVSRGQVTVLGAILSSSQVIHDICAPSSHSLPAIRFFSSDNEKAEILLHESQTNVYSLMNLSPLFAGLWSASTTNAETFEKAERDIVGSRGSSFQILLNRNETSRMGYCSTVSPPEWNELLSKLSTEGIKGGRTSVTMVCGPKSSGKSTFSRLLINRFLTISHAQEEDSSVAFLDLDPGQPEFSPPGQLSLLLLSKPNLGPPFSHPNGSKFGGKWVRAHSLSAVSPLSDPDFYMACAVDLFSWYVNMLLPNQYRLVINTPGWILGTGLELLINLIKEARPSQVIYMSQDGPFEVIESLQAAAKSIPVVTLPSQPTGNQPRTSAHLRTMQYMSYFHLDTKNRNNYAWNPNPITSMAPLEVNYAGKASGILGIICLGEQPPSQMLRDAIDGSLLAVIVIEDMAAILNSNELQKMGENIPNESTEDMSGIIGRGSDSDRSLFTEKTHSRRENSLILRTPEELPYFNPENMVSLDPRYSQTIGLAIVRGIDLKQKRLQLLTPISKDTIKDIRASGKAIVLVSGKLDTPGWAYLEALYKERADLKEENQMRQPEETMQDSEDDAEYIQNRSFDINHWDRFKDAPWVEILQGDKGREVGARVWRVRRDLGKIGGGGGD